MPLETANYVAELVKTNPMPNDPKSFGDDQLRLIKTVLLNSFAGFPGMVIVTGSEAQGATASDYTVTVSPEPAAYTASMLVVFKSTHANVGAATVQVNALGTKPLLAVDGTALKSGDIENGGLVAVFYDGVAFFLISGNDRAARAGDTYTGTHDFSNATQVVLPAATSIGNVSAAEIATLDGITGNIQGQIDGKVDKVGGTAQNLNLTGTPTAPTPALGDNSTKVATTAYVVQLAFQAALPAQVNDGNPRWLRSQNGVASWEFNSPDLPLMALGIV